MVSAGVSRDEAPWGLRAISRPGDEALRLSRSKRSRGCVRTRTPVCSRVPVSTSPSERTDSRTPIARTSSTETDSLASVRVGPRSPKRRRHAMSLETPLRRPDGQPQLPAVGRPVCPATVETRTEPERFATPLTVAVRILSPGPIPVSHSNTPCAAIGADTYKISVQDASFRRSAGSVFRQRPVDDSPIGRMVTARRT